MSYRSKSDHEKYTTAWVKQQPSPKQPTSPKAKLIGNSSNTSDLHHIPTALMVSPSGERVTCALENFESTSMNLKDTNPFSTNCKNTPDDDESDVSGNYISKFPSRNNRFREKMLNRRRIHAKDKRKVAKITITQKCVTARRQPKCVSVQTDESMSLISFPEMMGDGPRHSQSYMELMSSTRMDISSDNTTHKHYLSENQKKFLSFLLMIILIFWLTSIILDVEIPAEFCRIILNFIGSFKWRREKPQSFVEKILEYIKYNFQ
ncbi:uncharacterized protein LOC129906823 [Episyrphus balteatus]|uniref:uncharacterized protein LOC129906823 n=1 Tax=Episyrphus balteatus TaxID=286459 RepID=UPI002484F294|nr:uncharacterized protein LOC129906823 [Episyrphus balteatus]